MEEGFAINEIMSLLPHRYPFLLVDRITEWEPQTYIKGYKNITVNEPFFVGHFPEQPIMPGVLILEALAQVGGLLILKNLDKATEYLFLFTGVDNVRFRKPVVPGDRLDMCCTIVRGRLGIWKMDVEASVDGKVAASGTLSAAMIKKEGTGNV
ncbi:MAG: 3-hydroxyacyl-ACP dehydratase FabZ [Desulfovibrionaceae bacterium]